MKTLSLNGKYALSSTDGEYGCDAVIPGSDMGALINNGLIENPMNAPRGEDIACHAAQKDFVFQKTFFADGELFGYEHLVLRCEKLDTICEVVLNGCTVITASNAHVLHTADVKNVLRHGENRIELRFSSPLCYVRRRQKQRPLPPNMNGVNGAQYLRKPNCSFGWDWGPCIPYNYCGNIEIRAFNKDITDIRIRQNTTEKRSEITVSAKGADECFLLSPSGEKIGEGFCFTVDEPALWYTRDLSLTDTQPLYTVVLKNSETTVKKRIGLRNLRLNTQKDKWGVNFQFLLNGKRVFAKGGNVIPFSAIPEYGTGSEDYYIRLAADCNFNMLRVWGGGEYASDRFLDLCDELGILVWQDFCFACMMYPFDEKDFIDTVTAEAAYNVSRMEHHPCLALLCGNNEIEECNPVMPKGAAITKGYVRYFYSVLPALVKELSAVDYIPTSPVGKGPFRGNSREDVGDCHMWAVWHGLQPTNYYGTRYARFLSEFGMESLPSLKAINKFAPGESSLYSPPFMLHQKCAGGNKKLMYYLAERFGIDAPFDTLPYLTGIMQSECIQAATEHFRRNKGRCSGSVFWQLNDVWNAPSWSAVDFEKVPKALMYKAKSFFAPVTVSFSDGVLYLHNDTLYDREIKLTCRYTVNGRLTRYLSETVLSKADSVTPLHEAQVGENGILEVTADGKKYVFENLRRLEKAEITAERDGNALVLSSPVYARNVCIECDGVPAENYFPLLPGEEKRVEIPGDFDKYRVLCENNVKYTKKSLKKILFRLSFAMKPGNLVQKLWYAVQ